MVRLKKWCATWVSFGGNREQRCTSGARRGGGHVQRSEENQVKWKGVKYGNVRVINLPPHGEKPKDSHSTYPGSRRLWSRKRDIYMVSFPRVLKLAACPVDGCMARTHNPGRLREHFMYCHWKVKVAILQGGLEPL